ncbi:hypothetical protein O181_041491 [Austropuccinia psidii MF-1]|uniref:Uncharacterized protein n=1 Tax=Austropuccinia psidii MF-1 TaxID=1389203 RepID=A0A9Q3HEA4_9BASI|nr:hypothetical protein [Austropuccinia psidii MF-1]
MIENSKKPPQQKEKTVIEDHKDGREAAIAQIEEWENWEPPQISTENKNFQIKFGLTQTRQRSARQETQSQTQKEHRNETKKPLKRRYQVPTMRKMRQKRK